MPDQEKTESVEKTISVERSTTEPEKMVVPTTERTEKTESTTTEVKDK